MNLVWNYKAGYFETEIKLDSINWYNCDPQ